MDRENKITLRRVLLNISARCLLTPIYYHILLITRMLLLLYKKWWFISRLSIQFSHAPNYRVFVDVDILIVSEPPSSNTSFLNTFHTSATTDYYREIVHLILLPIFQLASPHLLKKIEEYPKQRARGARGRRRR